MCGRFIQTIKTSLIKKKFEIKNKFNENLISYNIAPSQNSLIITNNKYLNLESAKWGFQFKEKNSTVFKNVINSRIETLKTKYLFKVIISISGKDQNTIPFFTFIFVFVFSLNHALSSINSSFSQYLYKHSYIVFDLLIDKSRSLSQGKSLDSLLIPSKVPPSNQYSIFNLSRDLATSNKSDSAISLFLLDKVILYATYRFFNKNLESSSTGS